MYFSRLTRRLPTLLGLLGTSAALSGCNFVVMKPHGDIAQQQADLIVTSTALMLLIIVPVIAMTLFFAWRYRESNASATYAPEWDHSTRLELMIWGAPLLIILAIPLGSSLMCLRFLQVARNFTRTGELPHHDHGHVDGLDDEEAKDGHHRADRGRVAMAADHAGLPGPGDLLAEDVAVVAASADEVTQRALFMRLTSAYR